MFYSSLKKGIMLILQNIAYTHPDKDVLFDNIHLNLQHNDKVALIGDNGSGKSTLLKIIAGILQPSAGQVNADATPFYVPQIFGQYNHLTIAEALGIATKLDALKAILNGDVTETNMNLLEDDWTIEERCNEALDYWQLKNLGLAQKMGTLSGGQKTKVFLAGISIHKPKFVLLDEPSNHLDIAGRKLLYDFIRSEACSMIVVSHDRKLLNLLNTVFELSKKGITVYGGNYDFYAMQKAIENNALDQDIKNKEKSLRKAKDKERETLERQQKLDARGKKKQEKAGIPTIAINTLRNNAEKSTARIKGVHAEKIGDISKELQSLRKELPDIDKMKFGFDDSILHRGKILFSATDINLSYKKQMLWKEGITLQINSGERVALKGLNGSGKTTLIKIILGKLEPNAGKVFRANNKAVYIDQDYSLLDNILNVYEQAERFNATAFEEMKSRSGFTGSYLQKRTGTNLSLR